MIIWLTALFLMGLLALVGYYQGVIRVAVSLLGLFVAAALAMPISPVLNPLLPLVGLKHPFWREIIPPAVIFILVMIAFKVVGHVIHRKVDVFYKYKKDDKSRFKWERLNRRLGLSLGLANGAVYFILLMIPIYVAGYLTTLMASGEGDPARVQFINTARAQLHESNVDKVVAAYDPAPKGFYESADILGLMKINPLLSSRLSRYPAFLSLGERKEFQDMANDVQFFEMYQRGATIGETLDHPRTQAVVTNAEIVAQISQLIGSDINDLHEYLLTGKSAKYDDEKILGLWILNLNATVAQEKVANPKVTPFQLKKLKESKYATVSGTTFIATTDQKAILKNPPKNPETRAEIASQGTWEKRPGSGYQVTLGSKALDVTFDSGKLVLPRDGMTFVFEKEP